MQNTRSPIAILHVGGTNVGKDQSRQKLKGRAQEQ